MESISQPEYRGASSRSFSIAYQNPLIQYPTIYSFGQISIPCLLDQIWRLLPSVQVVLQVPRLIYIKPIQGFTGQI